MVQLSTLLVAALSSGFHLVSGSPVVAENADLARRDYDVVTAPDLHWKGFLGDGGEIVELSGGSFEEIENKAKAIDPSYTIFANTTDGLQAREALIGARQINYPVSVHCGWPPGWTPTWDFIALDAGINYLKGLQGWCRAAPGPGRCDRISCSWGSGIYFCNDNPNEIWVTCSDWGWVAHQIVSACADRGANGRTLGQAFHESHRWNVIVAAGDC